MIDTVAIIKKYYLDEAAQEIMLSHAIDVRDLALEIVDAHAELDADRQFVSEAAMLHDIGIFKVHAPGILCFGEYDYICHGYLGREILEQEGLPQHAMVCERHIGVGLTRNDILNQQLDVPYRTMEPISIEEQIVCFSDLFFSKSRLGVRLSVEKIEQKLQRHGRGKVLKFKKWCEMFL